MLQFSREVFEQAAQRTQTQRLAALREKCKVVVRTIPADRDGSAVHEVVLAHTFGEHDKVTAELVTQVINDALTRTF